MVIGSDSDSGSGSGAASRIRRQARRQRPSARARGRPRLGGRLGLGRYRLGLGLRLRLGGGLGSAAGSSAAAIGSGSGAGAASSAISSAWSPACGAAVISAGGSAACVSSAATGIGSSVAQADSFRRSSACTLLAWNVPAATTPSACGGRLIHHVGWKLPSWSIRRLGCSSITGDGRGAHPRLLCGCLPRAAGAYHTVKATPVPELPDLTIVAEASGTLHGSPRARCVRPTRRSWCERRRRSWHWQYHHHERQAAREVPPPAFARDGDVLILAANPMLAGRFWLLGSGKEKVRARTGLRLRFADGGELRYVDREMLGKLYLVEPDGLDAIPGWTEMGPDADDPELTLEVFRQRIRASRRAQVAAAEQSLRGRHRERLQRRDPLGGRLLLAQAQLAQARGDRPAVRGDAIGAR